MSATGSRSAPSRPMRNLGFAIRKGDPDSLNFLDNWIRVAEAEGWLKERKRYWFETKDWEKRIK